MPLQDAQQIKERMVSFLRMRGPSLPVQIAKDASMSILFTSAFLSELVSDRRIKMSNMRVGSSPVYFLPEHEPQLDRYYEHLKNKEKEAFLRLKEKKFLVDLEQEPAIRIALRAIKDFAIPFEKEGVMIWRYFTAVPEEYTHKIKEKSLEIEEQFTPPKIEPEVFEEPETEEPEFEEAEEQEEIEEPAPEEIKYKKSKEKKTKKPKKIIKKTPSSQDKFFNSVKEAITGKGYEITDIVGFSKTDLVLKIKDRKEEKLLVAFNKKKISDDDILKAYKKASEFSLPYMIISRGEPPKKVQNILDAAKNLSGIEEIP